MVAISYLHQLYEKIHFKNFQVHFIVILVSIILLLHIANVQIYKKKFLKEKVLF